MRSVFIFAMVLTGQMSFSQKECSFKIDTIKVFINENLPTFIKELSQEIFITKNNVDSIPQTVRKEINCIQSEFCMANPGEPYQVTDAVPKGKHLPWRQLTYLGANNHYLILTYKIGGFGVENHILLFKFDKNTILDFWGVMETSLKIRKLFYPT